VYSSTVDRFDVTVSDRRADPSASVVFQNNLKVIDFGFARGDLSPVEGEYKRSETYCGSYAYAAPEILMKVPYIPQLADVWSMGVILYVMVRRRQSFQCAIAVIRRGKA